MILLCESIIQEKFLNYDFDSFSIKNFIIKNDDSNPTIFNKQVYLFPSYAAYGHSLMDVYAQYKILKLKYPDLVPVIYDDGKNGYFFNNNKVTIDFMDNLSYSSKNIVNLSEGNYIFKEVIMFFDMNNTFPESFYSDNGLTRSSHYFPFCNCYMGIEECGESEYFKYNYLAIDILKNNFSHFFSKDKTDKIFVSRERYNNKYKSDIEFYLNKTNLSEGEKAIYDRATLRYFPHEKLIEDLFIQKGYKVIYAEDYGLVDQIKIFSSAKEIATISGTSLFNTFWCNNETTAFEIMAVNGYRYHYKEFANHAGVNHKYIEIFNMDIQSALKKINLEIP